MGWFDFYPYNVDWADEAAIWIIAIFGLILWGVIREWRSGK